MQSTFTQSDPFWPVTPKTLNNTCSCVNNTNLYIHIHAYTYLSINFFFFSFCIRSFFPPRFILLRTPPPLFGLCLTRDGSRHECWHVRTKFTNSLLSGHRRDWPPRCGHPGIRLLLHRLYFTVSNPVANSGVADWWRTESKPGK